MAKSAVIMGENSPGDNKDQTQDRSGKDDDVDAKALAQRNLHTVPRPIGFLIDRAGAVCRLYAPSTVEAGLDVDKGLLVTHKECLRYALTVARLVSFSKY